MDDCKASQDKEGEEIHSTLGGKKKKKKKSHMWKYFGLCSNDGSTNTICKECHCGTKYTKNTTVLVWHMIEERSINNYANININITVNPAASKVIGGSQ